MRLIELKVFFKALGQETANPSGLIATSQN